MENTNFSFRELIQRKKLTGETWQPAEYEAEKDAMIRSGINLGGSYIPANVRIVDSASGATRATLIERLRAHSMIYKLGARRLNNLIGNVRLATESLLVDTQWVNETGTINPVTDPTWTGEVIAPFRLYSTVPVSEGLLKLNGPEFEAYMFDAIMRSQAEALDNAFITGDGVTAPLGILNNTDIQTDDLGANGQALTLADILRAEEVATPNLYDAESLKYSYLMNAATKRTLKQTPKVANSDIMIMGGNALNGHNAAVSEHMPNDITLGTGTNLSALIYGNFHDVAVLSWGGFDLVVDRYTAARSGIVRVHVSSFMNLKVLRPELFHVTNGIITA